MDDAAQVTRCPRCGAEWLIDTPEGLCPACLLAGGAGPSSELTGDEMTTLSPRGVSSNAGQAGPRLVPGQVFGPYRIGRLLGRGGMGEVYEAEHIEQGRRVALKTLNQRLAGAHDRARFLREGQLAASISHPNSVYIFGSEEISGTPVIAMELLAGGTLKDRVKEGGPLPPAEAVDAILQVIAGLAAAHAGGVLHRDIKPANCFTDRDGTVKIGDFGLSISTLARDVTQLTMSGTFQGTPQFASPEQIRGEPLDVRADIYSVGATLYCLLAGQPPFDDKELVTLVTRIATAAPPSPRAVRPGVPFELAAITLSCLAKDRAARPATYAELTDRLRPFSSNAPTPATLGRRVLANIVDRAIITLGSVMPVNVYLLAAGAVSPGAQRWLEALQLAAVVAYYSVLEGYWSASIGKRLCRLRVIGRDGQRPGLARALARTLLFELSAAGLLLLPTPVDRLVGQPGFSATLLSLASYVVLRGLLFSTARRRNGFSGVHELISGTRVVERVRETARAVLDETLEAKPARTSPPRIGPYDIVGTLSSTDVGELLVGFDPALHRRVWVHALVPGAPPVAPLVRDLSRPGRLRWLGGRRRDGENWDAYEALDGLPFASVIRVSQPWRRVRHWLLDLARELDSGLHDGSLPRLTLDRIWIGGEGRARLLDFNAPGTTGPAAAPAPSLEDAQEFLGAVATRALGGEAGATPPLPGAPHRALVPLSASTMIRTLTARGFTSSHDVVSSIASLMSLPDTVTRWRRAVSIAPCVAGPALCAVSGALAMTMAQRAMTPDAAVLSVSLRELMSLPSQRVGDAASYRSALEVSIADRVAPMVADERSWHSPIVTLSMGRFRRLAEQILADHLYVSPDERAAATSALGSFLERQEQAARSPLWTLFPIVVRVQLMLFLTMPAAFGILGALLFRGGILMRALGIAVVTRTGQEPSPLRAAGRGLIAWLPLIAFLALLFRINPQRYSVFDSWQRYPVTVAAVAALAMISLGGALWAVLHPERGLQDRIAGTWLVPR